MTTDDEYKAARATLIAIADVLGVPIPDGSVEYIILPAPVFCSEDDAIGYLARQAKPISCVGFMTQRRVALGVFRRPVINFKTSRGEPLDWVEEMGRLYLGKFPAAQSVTVRGQIGEETLSVSEFRRWLADYDVLLADGGTREDPDDPTRVIFQAFPQEE